MYNRGSQYQKNRVLSINSHEVSVNLVIRRVVRSATMVAEVPCKALFELMKAMVDRWRVVKGWHHCALAAIAMGLRWLRERKQRVDEGSTAWG